MRVEVLFSGFPGKLKTGFMEWSAVIFFESGGKKVLFDTGGTGKRMTLLPRLAAVGVKPEEIGMVVFSHFHADHVYNFQYFPNAEFIMHEAEAAWAEKGEDLIQPPFFYDAVKATGRLRTVKEGEELVPGATTLHLPGHTPGCLALLLAADNMPKTVLAGDAIKNLTELATGSAGISLDSTATRNSAAKVRSLAERVIPGHDRILWVEKDYCYAENAAHETITIPEGCVQPDARHIDLVLEPTRLAIKG